MFPTSYPEKHAIELSLGNSSYKDHEPLFWKIEREQLRRQYQNHVKSRIDSGDIRPLSVVAMALQPLLIELGTLISDILPAAVYQLKREPSTWAWKKTVTVSDLPAKGLYYDPMFSPWRDLPTIVLCAFIRVRYIDCHIADVQQPGFVTIAPIVNEFG